MHMSYQVMDPPSLTSLDAFLFEEQDLATRRTRLCLVHFGVREDIRRVTGVSTHDLQITLPGQVGDGTHSPHSVKIRIPNS
jgi:hypothetical protein